MSDYNLPSPAKIGMELDVLPANLYFMYSSLFADADIVDVSPIIRKIRAVKSAYEIEQIRPCLQAVG